ncbi:MAG: dienelactone hydrolase family protein [Alphaproteobacteria bacterium]|nr:dienelactone hydrolase family protein [Alphaproteobacteria bacterium]
MGEALELTAADGHRLQAYLARPAGAARGGLVVAQEIFGVNGHIRDVCDRFAAVGYAALAPALFDRLERGVELDYDSEGVAKGREMRGQVGWEAVAADISAARDRLSPEGPVGIVGYCWGGSVAWLGATEGGFAAAVGYYGGHIIELNDRDPKCPTMLHFGDRDAAIPLSDVEKIRLAHLDVTIYVYEDAGHGFNCDRRGSHDEAAAALALERTLAFFEQHIG